jgi:hypothetical protein
VGDATADWLSNRWRSKLVDAAHLGNAQALWHGPMERMRHDPVDVIRPRR